MAALFRRIIRHTWQFIRLVFHFRRPQAVIECCQLVVEQRPILLVSWRMRYRYKLSIPEANFERFTRTGTYLIQLPDAISQIHIVIRSGWRRQQQFLQLQAIPASHAMLQQLVSPTQSMQWPVISDFKIAVNFRVCTILPELQVRPPQVELRSISLQVSTFHYQQPQYQPT